MCILYASLRYLLRNLEFSNFCILPNFIKTVSFTSQQNHISSIPSHHYIISCIICVLYASLCYLLHNLEFSNFCILSNLIKTISFTSQQNHISTIPSHHDIISCIICVLYASHCYLLHNLELSNFCISPNLIKTIYFTSQ
jgi:hypothetical protein